MNKPAGLPCILISSHKTRLRPTWRASCGHRIIPVCFHPNLSVLPTRFLSLCSQNLQKSTFYYCVSSLFSKVSHGGREFIFHCRRSRVHAESHLMRQWNPSGPLWPGKFRAPPSFRDTSNLMSERTFSEGYLCIESWVLWIHPTTVVCFMNYLHYHTIQYLLKIWIPSLEFETIFISKQIVSSFHVFWELKLSARKIWSFLKCIVFRTWCKNSWICPTEFLLRSSHLNVQFVETMK